MDWPYDHITRSSLKLIKLIDVSNYERWFKLWLLGCSCILEDIRIMIRFNILIWLQREFDVILARSQYIWVRTKYVKKNLCWFVGLIYSIIFDTTLLIPIYSQWYYHIFNYMFLFYKIALKLPRDPRLKRQNSNNSLLFLKISP